MIAAMSNKETAGELQLSPRGDRNHVSNIYAGFRLEDRTDLLRKVGSGPLG